MTVRVPWMSAPDGPKRLDNANAPKTNSSCCSSNPGSESRNYLLCVISDALYVFHDDVFNDSV
jgi:hypothetical protein